LLLLANLFWVLAYDTEYAMVDRDDDLKIGIQTSAITLGRFDVPAVMVFYAVYLVAWAWLGVAAGLGRIFLAGMVGAAMLSIWHYTLIRTRTREGLHGVRCGGAGLCSSPLLHPTGRVHLNCTNPNRTPGPRDPGPRAAFKGTAHAPRAPEGCARKPPRTWRFAG
jgi:hypothetical protein